jgi:thiosulfate/3-mercaptopyruvate sulfurtransferase
LDTQPSTRLFALGVESLLAIVLLGFAGWGTWQLNRPLPHAYELITSEVPVDAVLLDARGSLSYRRGHLPGAHSLWWRELLAFSGDMPGLLAEPDALEEALRSRGLSPEQTIVVYDNGDGQDAPLVLLVLHAFGLKAQLLTGGVTGWLETGSELTTTLPTTLSPHARPLTFDDKLLVDAAEAKANLEEALIAPLDVRTANAYLAGHIDTAINLPHEVLLPGGVFPRWSVLQQQFSQARLTPDTHPLIYASEASEAARAWLVLAAYGIEHLHVYGGPYQGLVEAGLPVSQLVNQAATSTQSSSVCWQ